MNAAERGKAWVQELMPAFRAFGHVPMLRRVHGVAMVECRLCGCRIGSQSGGRQCRTHPAP